MPLLGISLMSLLVKILSIRVADVLVILVGRVMAGYILFGVTKQMFLAAEAILIYSTNIMTKQQGGQWLNLYQTLWEIIHHMNHQCLLILIIMFM